MRTTYLLVVILSVGLVNAQLSSLLAGGIEGVIKGVVGAFYPAAKDGMSVAFRLFETSVRVSLNSMENIMKAAPQLVDNIQKTLGGMIQQVMNIVKGLNGMAQIPLKQITSMGKTASSSAFVTFGGMKHVEQKAIVNVGNNVINVFVTVLKLRTDTLKQAHKEIPLLRNVVESDHKNAHALFADLKSKAPRLSEAAHTVYSKGVEEYRVGFAKLDKNTKKGLTMMHDSIQLAQKGVTQILGKMGAGEKKEFGMVYHLLNNAMHVVNVAL